MIWSLQSADATKGCRYRWLARLTAASSLLGLLLVAGCSSAPETISGVVTLQREMAAEFHGPVGINLNNDTELQVSLPVEPPISRDTSEERSTARDAALFAYSRFRYRTRLTSVDIYLVNRHTTAVVSRFSWRAADLMPDTEAGARR